MTNSPAHIMKLEDIPFNAIELGRKTIEVRLCDEKRRKIKPEDRIEFNRTSDGASLLVTVLAVRHYKSIEDLVGAENFSKTGEIYIDKSEWKANINRYYHTGLQKKYGLIAIEISVQKI